MNDPRYIVLHHTAISGDGRQFDRVNAYHKSKGFPESSLRYFVGYHYLIEKSGEKRRAREDTDIGAHTVSYWPPYWGMNNKSIGICLAGDFTKEKPTVAQLKSLKELLEHYKSTYGIPDENVLLHRETKSTTCPGVDLVYLVENLFPPNYQQMLDKARNALKLAKGRRKRMLLRKISRLEKLIDDLSVDAPAA